MTISRWNMSMNDISSVYHVSWIIFADFQRNIVNMVNMQRGNFNWILKLLKYQQNHTKSASNYTKN